jgi:4-hydroxy-tetrahydrodipicolinate reductase
MTRLAVAVPGCAGRMGRALVQAIAASEEHALVGASEAGGSPAIGKDAGTVAGLSPLGVAVTDDPAVLLAGAAGVVDFTAPKVSCDLARRCADSGLPLVLGTTGLSQEERRWVSRAAKKIPIVFAPNTSVGVNVLFHLCAEAARLLGPSFDLEIVEAHHAGKVDSPSGTALRIADLLAAARLDEDAPRDRLRHGRRGSSKRQRGEIGLHAVRGGDIVGEHTVMFCGAGERVELVHRASSRRTFAAGALRALGWLVGRKPGLYSMQDVLGLNG